MTPKKIKRRSGHRNPTNDTTELNLETDVYIAAGKNVFHAPSFHGVGPVDEPSVSIVGTWSLGRLLSLPSRCALPLAR